MFGFFFGRRRNDPVRLVDPRPLTDYGDAQCSGDAGLDGFTVLSRSNPNAEGAPPSVRGVVGPEHRGPDMSFER